MNNKETLNAIKEYIEKEDFNLDQKYISISRLEDIFNRKIRHVLDMNSLKTDANYERYKKNYGKLFNGYKIDKIEYEANPDFIDIIFNLVKFNKENHLIIRKYRDDDMFVLDNYHLNNNEKEYFSSLLIANSLETKIKSIEKLYDTLKLEDKVGDIRDIELIPYGVYTINAEMFTVYITLSEDNSPKLDFDILINDCPEQLRYYIKTGRICDIVNESKVILKKKIKIKISDLPEKLQILVKDELKIIENNKKLEKKLWDKEPTINYD